MSLPNFANTFGVTLKNLVINPTTFSDSLTVSVGLTGTPSEPLEIYCTLGTFNTTRQPVKAESVHDFQITNLDVVAGIGTAKGAMNILVTIENGVGTKVTINPSIFRESVTDVKYTRTFKEYSGGYATARCTRVNDKVEPEGTSAVYESTYVGDSIFEVPAVPDLLKMELVE